MKGLDTVESLSAEVSDNLSTRSTFNKQEPSNFYYCKVDFVFLWYVQILLNYF